MKRSQILTIALISLVTIVIFVRIDVESSFIIGILGITTFLFSALVAASLTERQRRIEQIREHDSIERAMISYIYETSQIWGDSFQKSTQKLLDDYLMSIFIYRIEDYHLTKDRYQVLYRHILEAPVNTKKQQTGFQMLIRAFEGLTKARKQTIALFEDKLPRSELFASLFLGLLIILGLVSLNTGTALSISIVIGLSSVVIVLVSTLFSLNTAAYQYEQRILEPYQKTFESIGLLRYYPEEFIAAGMVKLLPKNTPYRVGVFAHPYPDTTGFEVKIINNDTN